MFLRVKFICFYAECKESYLLEKIHHQEMFEYPHRSILSPAQGCQFINNVETVIIHSINCPFHLLYCAICKSLCNVSVCTHDCKVIKSQCKIISVFKYDHNISPPNHSNKDDVLRTNSYIETIEDRAKINYDMLMSVALIKPPPTAFFTTRRILQRQNAVEDYYLLHIIIYTDVIFFLSLFLIVIDIFYFENIFYCYSSCLLQLLVLVY